MTPPPGIRIRRLAAHDKPGWLALFRAYITFYQASVAGDVIDETFRRLLSGEEGFHIGYVAVDESGTPVGLAHVLFHRSTWSKTWYCYLEDLFVRPDIRGKGIGKALIAEVLAESGRRGATRTHWTTQEFNYRARSLYDQMATKAPFVQYRCEHPVR